MTAKKFRETVRDTKQFLLNSSVSFFGKEKYSDYFDDKGNITINDDIAGIVKQYHSLDIWDKIWMYLTTPIHHYLVFNDILVLNEMESSTLEQSVVLYDYYHLGQHSEYLGWLIDSIHSELEKDMSEIRISNPPDGMTKLDIMDRDLKIMRHRLSEMSVKMTWLEKKVEENNIRPDR